MTVLSGTGSRDLAIAPPSHRLRVMTEIRRQLRIEGPEYVIAGGAEGFDHALALTAFSEDISVILAIPSPSYGEYYWRDHSVTGRNRWTEWQMMVDDAEKVICISSWHLYGRANFIRNQWMVDNAEPFLVYKPFSRGTKDCVQRLNAAGKRYHVIEIPCPDCGDNLHYNRAEPVCERCTHELCDDCMQAEERTWD